MLAWIRFVRFAAATLLFAMAASPTQAVLTVFSEDFGATGVVCPPGGPVPFPAGWTRYNVDGGTPNAAVAFVNDAWIVREDFGQSVVNCIAFSTSWYDPAGQADDWMVTPAITVPTVNPQLIFRARAYDPLFRDGFEVRWATTNSVASFLANPALLTVAAENSTWTTHTIDLAAHAGQSVYFAFRNNSTDQYVLVMDDIQVASVPVYDGVITSVLRPLDLLRIPVTQGYPLQLGATILNDGAQPLTNLVVTARVRVDGVDVHTVASAPVATLAPSASTSVAMAPHVVTQLGVVTVEYTLASAETDDVPANNTMPSTSLAVTTTELAGDDGTAVGQIGIGAGSGGQLGNTFHLQSAATVKAIRYYTTASSSELAGDGIVGEIRSMTTTPPIEPGTQIVQTQPYIVPAPPVAGFVDLIPTATTTLAAGDYYFGLIEPVADPGEADTLDIGLATNVYVPGRSWVDWPTNPLPGGAWGHFEDFGSQFAKPLMVRVILATDAALSATKVASPSPVAAGGTLTYTITVTNNGPGIATDLVVTDPLPAGTTFVSAGGTGWTCSQAAGAVTCALPLLAVGAAAPPISIVVTAPSAVVSLTNTATIAASSIGTASATATTSVVAADVAVTKSGPASVAAGSDMTYSISVANAGALAASNVALTDILPVGVTFVSGAQNSGPSFTCTTRPAAPPAR